MNAKDIVTQMVATLMKAGQPASVGAPVQYGHKLTIPGFGSVVVYVGKKGPRLTTNELINPSGALITLIEEVFTAATSATVEASPPVVEPEPTITPGPVVDTNSPFVDICSYQAKRAMSKR